MNKKEKRKEQYRTWKKNNKDHVNRYNRRVTEERKSKGLCIRCGKIPHLKNQSRCEKCQQISTEVVRKSKAKLRDQVFTAYGGYVCKCCGETGRRFLSIDHIDESGSEHRKIVDAATFYSWLRRNKYPKGFQVLCHNCNFAKGLCGGICPHKLENKSPDAFTWIG